MSSFTYSVYIPRLNKDIKDANKLISDKFQEENLGNASRIDILKVFNEKGTWVYNKAFVHFDLWFNTDSARKMQTEIESRQGRARLYYHEHNYWMLLPNDSSKVPEQPIQTIQEADAENNANTQPAYPNYGFQYPMVPNMYAYHPMMYPMMYPQPNDNRPVYYSNYTAQEHFANKNAMEVEKNA